MNICLTSEQLFDHYEFELNETSIGSQLREFIINRSIMK